MRRSSFDAPEGVTALVGDAVRLERLPAVQDVVCCVSPGRSGRTPEGYRRAYVDVPAHLVALARSSGGCRRLVLVSSTGVYGADDGRVVDDSTTANPSHWRGEILLEGERAALDGEGVAFREVLVLRCAGIYGPGREALLRSVRGGDSGRVGRWTNRIHNEDAARAVAFLLEVPDPGPSPRVFLGVDDEPSDDWEVRAWIAAQLGLEVPDCVSVDARNKRCVATRLRALGWEPSFPSYREGYGAMLPT